MIAVWEVKPPEWWQTPARDESSRRRSKPDVFCYDDHVLIELGQLELVLADRIVSSEWRRLRVRSALAKIWIVDMLVGFYRAVGHRAHSPLGMTRRVRMSFRARPPPSSSSTKMRRV